MKRILSVFLAAALMIALMSAPARADGVDILDVCESYISFINDIYMIRLTFLERLNELVTRGDTDYAGMIRLCKDTANAIRLSEWILPELDAGALTAPQAALYFDIEYLNSICDTLYTSDVSDYEMLAVLLAGEDIARCAVVTDRLLRVYPYDARLFIASTNEELAKLDLPRERLEAFYEAKMFTLPAFASYASPYETDVDMLIMRQEALFAKMTLILLEIVNDVDDIETVLSEFRAKLYQTMLENGLSESEALNVVDHIIDSYIGNAPWPLFPPDAAADAACAELYAVSLEPLRALNHINMCLFDAVIAINQFEAVPSQPNRLRALGTCYAAKLALFSEINAPAPLPEATNARLNELGIISDLHSYFHSYLAIQTENLPEVVNKCIRSLLVSIPDIGFLSVQRDGIISMLTMSLDYSIVLKDYILTRLPESDHTYWQALYDSLDMFEILS